MAVCDEGTSKWMLQYGHVAPYTITGIHHRTQHVEVLQDAVDALYAALSPLLQPQEGAHAGPMDDGRAVQVLLDDAPVVWVGDGFRQAHVVALHTSSNWRYAAALRCAGHHVLIRPFLFSVPSELARHAAVLSALLGVAAECGVSHLVRALQAAAAMGKGPLEPELLDVVVEMVRS